MIPEWFKVGAKIWFMGFDAETEVLSINMDEGTWVGLDLDSKKIYGLDEVAQYWKPNYSHPDNKSVVIQ